MASPALAKAKWRGDAHLNASPGAVERARRDEPPGAAFPRRQEPGQARFLYLQLDRATAFFVVLNCEETNTVVTGLTEQLPSENSE